MRFTFQISAGLPRHPQVEQQAHGLAQGNVVVIMRTECRPDGFFVITSAGEKFGDPGFYFTLHGSSGQVWARHVRSLRESIHV